MRALLKAQMLAPEVPRHIHQLHGVERAAASPRRASRVRGLSLKIELHRDEAALRSLPPRSSEIVAHMREENYINILEHACAHEVRLASQQLFGHSGPDLDRTGKMIALHDLL